MTDRPAAGRSHDSFIAGHETTALALSWTWYLLSQHPDVEAKLWRRAHATLGGRPPKRGGSPPVDLHGKRRDGIAAPLSARLRICREALQDCEIGGYAVPKGTTLFMSQWLMHRSSRYFPDPEAFMPDRWADGLAKRLPKYAYCPSGAALASVSAAASP